MAPKQIQGFTVLPLRFSSSSTSNHEIFIKEHVIRNQSIETPLGRTLFAVNIPPYATKESLKHVFSAAGEVSNVIFQKRPTTQMEDRDAAINGFKVAFVVFEKTSGLKNALKLEKLDCLSTDEKPVLCGIMKWAKEYNNTIINSDVLQKKIDNFMKKFDVDAENKKKKEKQEGDVDDEGWITVTKQGRKPGFARKASVQDKIKEKMENSRKKKELKNFYTFQIRESKMKHLANLRVKFEEDKKKISVLRQARRFRPY